MIKKEKNFSAVLSEIKVGEAAILKLPTGEVVMTSPVEDFFHSFTGEWKISTRNTIYRCYN